MCRITSNLKLSDQKCLQISPLNRRKYQELEGKPINLVRYEFKCEVGEKVEVQKQEKKFADYWEKLETAAQYPDEREQLWSENRMELFESFYNIPPDIGVTESEYDLEKVSNFDNYEYLTPPSFDDD